NDEPRLREYLARDRRLFEAAQEQLVVQKIRVQQLLDQIAAIPNDPDSVAARQAAVQAVVDAELVLEQAETPDERAAAQETLAEALRDLDAVFRELQTLYTEAGVAEEQVERIVRGLQGTQ